MSFSWKAGNFCLAHTIIPVILILGTFFLCACSFPAAGHDLFIVSISQFPLLPSVKENSTEGRG